MKVIIAGGSGFMGSHFVQYMAGKYPENQIINLDIYEDKQKLRSMEDMANYQFMRWNLTNREAVFHLLDTVKPDIIINFAQEQRDPCGMDSYAEKSETAAINLLDACRTCGIRRYHHVSSEKIYGTRPPYHTPHIFTEETPIAVSDAFSPVMTDADLTARMYHRFDGLPVTISRCSKNYGPYCSQNEFPFTVVRKALAEETIIPETDGETINGWLYVADHCRALDLIINEGKDGEIYHIASESILTKTEAVKTIVRILNKPEDLVYCSKDNGNHKRQSVLDTSKITQALGWVPSYDFETGLRKTILWYMTQQN